MNFPKLPIDFSLRTKSESSEYSVRTQREKVFDKPDELRKQKERVRRAFEYVNIELERRQRSK